MKTSAPGRALIEQREGKRLTAYRDSVGVLTVGVGHTGRMSPPPVTAGMTITEAQCDAFLAGDLVPVESAINAALKVPVTQNEFDAMVSLWFNVGTGYVKTSAIIKRLNLGDVAGAAAGFDAYHKPAAIIGRRNGEKAQFLDVSAAHPVVVARAQTLGALAATSKAKAKTTATGGAATALGGAALAAGAAHTSHHTAAMVIAGIVVVGLVVDGVLFWLKHRTAKTLAANAVGQAIVAASLAPHAGARATGPAPAPIVAAPVPTPPAVAAAAPAIPLAK